MCGEFMRLVVRGAASSTFRALPAAGHAVDA